MDENVLQSIREAEAKAEEIVKSAEQERESALSSARADANAMLEKETAKFGEEMRRGMEEEKIRITEKKREIEEQRAREVKKIRDKSSKNEEKAMALLEKEFEDMLK